MLFTPLYNKTEPVLWGLPYFYWAQLVFVVVGVVTVFIVFRMTRDRRPNRLDKRAGGRRGGAR